MSVDMDRLKQSPELIITHNITEQHEISYRDVEEIQLAAARKRFDELVHRIPMIARLAEEQGIREIRSIEDLAPLLMMHSAYKSYPLSVLEGAKFDRLTRWLDGLTVHDLSKLDVSECETIDEWIGVLNRETPIRVLHSTGTSGKLSFIPRSADEVAHSFHGHLRMIESFGDEPPALGVPPQETVVIAPQYRHGAMALHRYLDAIEDALFDDQDHIITINPGYFSADLASLGGRLKAAEARGELGSIQLSSKLAEKREAFLKDQRESPDRMEAFLDRLCALEGRCVWFVGGTAPALIGLANAAQKRGMNNMFREDSYASGGGGGKGIVLPDGWTDMVRDVLGVSRLQPGYGMTELTCMTRICPEGHFHVPPWQIPFLLDPVTGIPYPRTGTHIGRYGVFDLNARTYWGGFLTGDELTLSWGDTEPCGCGRIGPYIHRAIRRYSEKEGGDDKITCAGAPDAHDKAIEYLLQDMN